MSNKIICRKCGGEHLTIKCGKNKQDTNVLVPPIIETVTPVLKVELTREKPVLETLSRTNNNKEYDYKKRYNKSTNYDKNNIATVKLSDLPLDTTESELYELLQDWGHIVKVKVLSYIECNIAYIDFIYNDEAEYFIKAIDKTPFDMYIISAVLCSNKN
jgi:RNA recognition motif-containing protein